jgi:DeoR/GlpR family transcriptional regulator of sugar metabolism
MENPTEIQGELPTEKATYAQKRKNKEQAKNQIVEILSSSGKWQSIKKITGLIDCVSQTTVNRYLKELEIEGKVYRITGLWSQKQ